eukprot:scaffold96569_cov61-Attheya_sp.AAC.1
MLPRPERGCDPKLPSRRSPYFPRQPSSFQRSHASRISINVPFSDLLIAHYLASRGLERITIGNHSLGRPMQCTQGTIPRCGRGSETHG